MNSTEFRKAFHVNENVGEYVTTNKNIIYNYVSQIESSAWIYDIFPKYGYKMMHVMGDSDGILSLPGAWKWLKDRKFKVKTEWTPWLNRNQQLVGYVKEF